MQRKEPADRLGFTALQKIKTGSRIIFTVKGRTRNGPAFSLSLLIVKPGIDYCGSAVDNNRIT
jgi:hypothetical protein